MPFTGSGTGIQNADDVFFNTVNDGETLVYNSGTAKWNNGSIAGGSGSGAPLLVAAATAPQSVKDAAAYTCDGIDDQVTIQQALDALPTNRGGRVLCWVISAKQPSTRARRIDRTIEELLEGKRRPCCWGGCPHREKSSRDFSSKK